MKLATAPVLLSLLLCCCLAMGADDDARSNKSEGRRRGIFGITPFRPIMRVLGMMGLPLLPLLLLRQLLAGAGAGNQQGAGAGAGMGSLGALGLLGPFGAGTGLGGIRPGGLGGGASGLAALLGGGGGGAGGAGGAGNTGAAALFLQKRSAADRLQPLLGALARLERAVDQYDLGAPDCQRRIVCELHRKTIKPSVGSLTEKLIQAFGVEARLERSRFTSNTKAVLKDFLKAARNGLQQRDCEAIYYKCPIAIGTTRRSDNQAYESNAQNVTNSKESPHT